MSGNNRLGMNLVPDVFLGLSSLRFLFVIHVNVWDSCHSEIQAVGLTALKSDLFIHIRNLTGLNLFFNPIGLVERGFIASFPRLSELFDSVALLSLTVKHYYLPWIDSVYCFFLCMS